MTDVLAKRAVQVVNTTPKNEPLFLWFAPKAPHVPATVARRHRGDFADADTPFGGSFDKAERKRLGSLSAADEAVVKIADAMGTRWDSACIFVLSDNGYLLGEHDRTGKGVWWDGSVRVPMLARCPGISGAVDARLSANIDVAPTIALATGLEIPAAVDGRPLQASWERERVLIEGWLEGDRFSGVKTEDAVYVEESGQPARYYERSDAESTDRIGQINAALWAGELAALRNCAGATCRAADGGG